MSPNEFPPWKKKQNTQASPHEQLVDVKFLFKVFFGEIYWIPALREHRQHKRERKIVLLKTLIDHHHPSPSIHHPPYLHTDTQLQRNAQWQDTLGQPKTCTYTRTHTSRVIHHCGDPPPLLHCDWMSGWPSVATCWPIDFASQCGPTQCRDVCLSSVLSDTHLLSPTHTQAYAYSALLLFGRLVFISASVVSNHH